MAATTVIQGRTVKDLAGRNERLFIRRDVELSAAVKLTLQTSLEIVESVRVSRISNSAGGAATSIIAVVNSSDKSKVDITAVGAGAGTTKVAVKCHGYGMA